MLVHCIGRDRGLTGGSDQRGWLQALGPVWIGMLQGVCGHLAVAGGKSGLFRVGRLARIRQQRGTTELDGQIREQGGVKARPRSRTGNPSEVQQHQLTDTALKFPKKAGSRL